MYWFFFKSLQNVVGLGATHAVNGWELGPFAATVSMRTCAEYTALQDTPWNLKEDTPARTVECRFAAATQVRHI